MCFNDTTFFTLFFSFHWASNDFSSLLHPDVGLLGVGHDGIQKLIRSVISVTSVCNGETEAENQFENCMNYLSGPKLKVQDNVKARGEAKPNSGSLRHVARGVMFQHGLGVIQNNQEAVRYFKFAFD